MASKHSQKATWNGFWHTVLCQKPSSPWLEAFFGGLYWIIREILRMSLLQKSKLNTRICLTFLEKIPNKKPKTVRPNYKKSPKIRNSKFKHGWLPASLSTFQHPPSLWSPPKQHQLVLLHLDVSSGPPFWCRLAPPHLCRIEQHRIQQVVAQISGSSNRKRKRCWKEHVGHQQQLNSPFLGNKCVPPYRGL